MKFCNMMEQCKEIKVTIVSLSEKTYWTRNGEYLPLIWAQKLECFVLEFSLIIFLKVFRMTGYYK